MAARRLASSTINWAAFAERVPESQKQNFLVLKNRTDLYLRRVNANPAEAPKIDWTVYKSKIAIPGLVDQFQKQYESFQIPYPPDNVTPQIVAQEKQGAENVKKFITESNQRIKDYEARIAKWATVLPYEEMTIEEYYEAHPERALDTVNNPTFWPHEPEDQPDYVPPEASAEADAKKQ